MTETSRGHEETNATNPVGKFENFVSKHFVRLLVWLAVSGGALAIFGPWILYVTGFTGETDANLRLHILYVTGGTIAVLGLVETHRKNITDRIKAEADIQNYQASQSHQSKTLDEQARQFTETIAKEREKIEADKAKNEQDHIRQVHAERRSRYTTAIEQLSSDKASIRLGGVYTLVGLVDEWLADEKTIPSIEERRKEGQVIINNLCAYIRSSFVLVSKIKELSEGTDTPKDYSGGTQQFIKDQARFREEKELRKTILDAIRARLNGGAIIQEDETKKLLKGPWSDFDYDFSNTVFFYPVGFNNSYFGASSNFSGAEFIGNADFSKVTFTEANFSEVTFTQAKFTQAKFTGDADFSEAEFTSHPDFSRVTFIEANFSGAEFTGNAVFSGAEFTGNADFSEVKFTRHPDFSEYVDFSEATFEDKPKFEYTLDNKTYKTRFSCKAAPEDYNFKVSHDSPCIIETEEQEHNGVKFIIPEDAELFDPDEPSKSEQDVPYI